MKDLMKDGGEDLMTEEEIRAMDTKNIKALVPLFADEAAADGATVSEGYIIKMLLLQGSQEVSIATHFRALIDKGFMEIKPGTQYVIYVYAMNSMGYPMSQISSTAALTAGEAPNNGGGDNSDGRAYCNHQLLCRDREICIY